MLDKDYIDEDLTDDIEELKLNGLVEEVQINLFGAKVGEKEVLQPWKEIGDALDQNEGITKFWFDVRSTEITNMGL